MFRDLRAYGQKKAWAPWTLLVMFLLSEFNDLIGYWRNEDFLVSRVGGLHGATTIITSPFVALALLAIGLGWLAWIGRHYHPASAGAIDKAVDLIELELEARITEGKAMLGVAFNYYQYKDWTASARADLGEGFGSYSQLSQAFKTAGLVTGVDVALEPARKRAIERQIAVLTQALERLRTK